MTTIYDNGQGRLAQWEDAILMDLSQRTGGDLKWKVLCFENVTSTMDEAKKLLKSEISKPALILAHRQDKGRGRFGRAWQGCEVGFYATYVFPLGQKAEAGLIAPFTLVAGVVVAEELWKLGCELYLKWPNDIVSKKGEKVSGILTEFLTSAGHGYLLLGIGINLKGVPQVDIPVSSLELISGKSILPYELAGVISMPLYNALENFLRDGFCAYRRRWIKKAWGIGKRVTVILSGREYEGDYVGINDSGGLLLRAGGDVLEFLSAERLRFG